ncbi:hypothetical protein QJS10_CPB13g01445 [Acorus calamus]|uniref:Uncharacterized protein n=1 Tax=Acorus calamus TaxID=4465 RepID=A0AAV9DHN3_ACOCL|nr:hypothetical protein QJS10_CPB13g01445 [Acorus calamus]
MGTGTMMGTVVVIVIVTVVGIMEGVGDLESASSVESLVILLGSAHQVEVIDTVAGMTVMVVVVMALIVMGIVMVDAAEIQGVVGILVVTVPIVIVLAHMNVQVEAIVLDQMLGLLEMNFWLWGLPEGECGQRFAVICVHRTHSLFSVWSLNGILSDGTCYVFFQIRMNDALVGCLFLFLLGKFGGVVFYL